MVVEPPLIMNRSLAEYGDWQRPLECLLKENFDRSSLGQQPVSDATVTNERSRSHQRAPTNRAQLSQLLLAFDFNERLRDLCISRADLLLYPADLQICIGHCAFRVIKFAFRDQALRKKTLRFVAARFSFLDAFLIEREQFLQAGLVVVCRLDVFVAQFRELTGLLSWGRLRRSRGFFLRIDGSCNHRQHY